MSIAIAEKPNGTINVGTKLTMGIHEKSLSKILESLTVMYSNPHYAVLREYTSNAFDSHTLAKTHKPVEVSLPNILNPELVIRDYGIGMSRADVFDIYSQFGASTKENTNSQIGKFGLGSKSALAVAGGYTFTAVQNGKMNRVLVARNSQDIPEFNILDETDTDQENGVEVRIPATPADFNEYESAVYKGVFFAWPENSVLVNEKVPSTEDGSLWNSKNWKNLVENKIWHSAKEPYYYRQEEGLSSNVKILVGPVAYTIAEKKSRDEIDALVKEKLGTKNNIIIKNTFVVRVPNGSVRFVPNRDTFVYDKATKETLANAIVEAINTYTELAKATIDKQETYYDAVAASLKFTNMLNLPHTFKGKKFGKFASILNARYVGAVQNTRLVQIQDNRAVNNPGYNARPTANTIIISGAPLHSLAGIAGFASTVNTNSFLLVADSISNWDENFEGSSNHVTYEQVTEIARNVRNSKAAEARAARATTTVDKETVTLNAYYNSSSVKAIITPETVVNKKFVKVLMSEKAEARVIRAVKSSSNNYINKVAEIVSAMQQNGYVFIAITKAQSLEKAQSILGNENVLMSLDEAMSEYITELTEKTVNDNAVLASILETVNIYSNLLDTFIDKIEDENTRVWAETAFSAKEKNSFIKLSATYANCFRYAEVSSAFVKTLEALNETTEKIDAARKAFVYPYPMLILVRHINDKKAIEEAAAYVNLVDSNK
jgi:hypothetical protein